MSLAEKLVLRRQRHLKWRAFDRLEMILMIMCGVCLFGFTTSVAFDIITRTVGHPWLWLQEVTSAFFIYGIFTGAAVATRRNDHLYLTAVAEAMHGRSRLVVEVTVRIVTFCVALFLIYFGYINFVRGFGSYRMPSMTPIASLYVAIPISGVLIALFTIEQLINGCKNGFEHPEEPEPESTIEKPQPARPGAVRAGQGGVPIPKILRRVEPEFPPGAKGTVILEVTIGPDGTVTDVRVLRGDPALDAAAIKAVRQWLFEVSRIDGRPAAVVYTATVAAR